MMRETEMIEFKAILNDKFEKEVVAFLNTAHGGSIYLGVDDDGEVIGIQDIDAVELQIKDRIKNNIAPSSIGLFEIITLEEKGKNYIQIMISGGSQKPYYIRKYGMSPEGCYIRIGTSAEKMTEELIQRLFQKRERNTLVDMISPTQELTFKELYYLYQSKGHDVGDNLLNQLYFYTSDKQFNYLAYLFSDQNALEFQYARYKGNDVFDLAENKVFSNQCILKTAKEILDYLKNRNVTYTKITDTGRKETQKFSDIAVREIVINAIVHNDYRSGALPTFEEFDNRLEISSFGGLPEGFSKDDFFSGYSLPVNQELIRIFRDMGLAERLGTGIRRVLRFYPKEIFSFSTHFLRVNVPFEIPEKKETFEIESLSWKILNELEQNPELTRKELAEALKVSESTLYRELNQLKKDGYIERVGSTKDGHWVVLHR